MFYLYFAHVRSFQRARLDKFVALKCNTASDAFHLNLKNCPNTCLEARHEIYVTKEEGVFYGPPPPKQLLLQWLRLERKENSTQHLCIAHKRMIVSERESHVDGPRVLYNHRALVNRRSLQEN